MKNLFIKYRLELLGVLVGAISGWLYWYFIGCATNTCNITSSPINSSLYGALMGGILFSMLKKETKTNKQKTQHK